MSNLSSQKVQQIKSLYESIYREVLTEEKQNELLMIEWYNCLVEEGYIVGDKIEETYEQETLNEVWGNLGAAVTKYGPKVFGALKQVTGYGTKPTTKLGTVVRAGQQAATPTVGLNLGATDTKPGIRDRIVGGATQGATGVAKGFMDPKKTERMRGF